MGGKKGFAPPRTALSRVEPKLERDAWRFRLDTYARVVSRGVWKPYNHLMWLARRVGAGILRGEYRAIVNMPPRHGKSWTMSRWLPAWFLSLYSDRQILLTSYEATFAALWGRDVRDILDAHIRKDQRAAHDWRLRGSQGGMKTSGVGGPIVGRGGDLLLLDDPHKNWKEANSAAKLKEIRDWWESTFMTRQEPGASIVVTMTRWHDEDMTGWLLDEYPPEYWDHITFPAIALEDDCLGRSMGDALCPERYTVEALERIRDQEVGYEKFQGLYQQMPVKSHGPILRQVIDDHLEYWTDFDAMVDREWDALVLSCDATFGARGDSYDCIEIWGLDDQEMVFIWQWRGQWHADEFIDKLREALKWIERHFGDIDLLEEIFLENKASGPAIAQILESDEIFGELMELVEPLGSKIQRAQSIRPTIRGGRVSAPCPECFPWMKRDVLPELRRFPYYPTDDVVDTWTQAIIKLRDYETGIGSA